MVFRAKLYIFAEVICFGDSRPQNLSGEVSAWLEEGRRFDSGSWS